MFIEASVSSCRNRAGRGNGRTIPDRMGHKPRREMARSALALASLGRDNAGVQVGAFADG